MCNLCDCSADSQQSSQQWLSQPALNRRKPSIFPSYPLQLSKSSGVSEPLILKVFYKCQAERELWSGQSILTVVAVVWFALLHKCLSPGQRCPWPVLHSSGWCTSLVSGFPHLGSKIIDQFIYPKQYCFPKCSQVSFMLGQKQLRPPFFSVI